MTLLSLGGLTGHISIASLAGLFRPENALMLGVMFMAGPGAILTALTLDGAMKQRIIAALLAGIVATIVVILAAGIGTKALSILNTKILTIMGGIAIMLIGLIMIGLKINENIPLAIILLGLIGGLIWK